MVVLTLPPIEARCPLSRVRTAPVGAGAADGSIPTVRRPWQIAIRAEKSSAAGESCPTQGRWQAPEAPW